MATNDKFIQSIVELLDKLIDHQSKNANLLTELKSSLFELRNDASDILVNLREKLPESLSYEQEELYRKISNTTTRIEDNNSRIYDNIKTFDQNYQNLKNILENNNEILNRIHANILEKLQKNENKKLEETVNEIGQFISSLKSKKAWIALIIAGITTLATAISAVVSGINSFKEPTTASTNTTNNTTTTPNTIKP